MKNLSESNRQMLLIAVEFGYRRCENGDNLEAALEKAAGLLVETKKSDRV